MWLRILALITVAGAESQCRDSFGQEEDLTELLQNSQFAVQRALFKTPCDTAQWMAWHWSALQDRTLLNVTLPGSHNSGNNMELGAKRLCSSDYKYPDFKASVGNHIGPKHQHALLPESEFNAAFLPWNVNHHHTISDQLKAGIRWFHLKLCWVRPVHGNLTLSDVLHEHRGYTSISLDCILQEMLDFLADADKEFVVLGFNNLANFDEDSKRMLASLVHEKFLTSGVKTVQESELAHSTLSILQGRNARAALFFPVSGMLDGIIRSSSSLYENWDDAALAGGNLEMAKQWLIKDIESYATRHDRFYVMQANPNAPDDDSIFPNMYTEVQAGSRLSLFDWEKPFLHGLKALVTEALWKAEGATINAISTDFQDESRVVELALELMFGSKM